MAAVIGSIKGKVLFQIADREPVEVGTLLIPVQVSGPSAIGHSMHVEINLDPNGFPTETDARIEPRFAGQRSDRNGLLVDTAHQKIVVNEPGELSFEFLQAIIDGKLTEGFDGGT